MARDIHAIADRHVRRRLEAALVLLDLPQGER
jgi:hypothetical protein